MERFFVHLNFQQLKQHISNDEKLSSPFNTVIHVFNRKATANCMYHCYDLGIKSVATSSYQNFLFCIEDRLNFLLNFQNIANYFTNDIKSELKASLARAFPEILLKCLKADLVRELSHFVH